MRASSRCCWFFYRRSRFGPRKTRSLLDGIECDGATYHSAKSTRDRDRLRQTILERLGWNIRRIWSVDWFKNPYGILKPLVRELHELKSTAEPFDTEAPSEVNEIDEIIEEVEAEEVQSDKFAFNDDSLKEKLIQFDLEVIRNKFPDTPESNRLLRPAMIEALCEYTPTSKVEFLESIPFYIRQATIASEGQFLAQVFDIINASLEEV